MTGQAEAAGAALLGDLFDPRGVAVVGASPKGSNPSRRALKQLARHGFPGHIAAVNPGYDEVDGVPCFPSILDVPHPVDLALVFVPARHVADVVMEAGKAGCGAAIVFSSGFAELGPDGTAMQADLRDASERAGVRLLGPNCQGVVHFPSHLVATFTGAVGGGELPPVAPFAYVGQSGAVGGSFFDLSRARGVTPQSWISTGNQADLGAADAARALVDGHETDLVCVYLEQVPPGPQWRGLAEAAADAGVRLAVLRSGRSEAGKRAAASHTGAMVGPERAFELLCEENSVIVVDDVDELVDLAVALPTADRGRRVGIITTSGGAGCLLVDTAEASAFEVPELTEATRDRLRDLVPSFGALANPVDVTAQLFTNGGQDFAAICEIVAQDPNIDQLMIVLTMVTGQIANDLAESVVEMRERIEIPVSVVYLAAHERTDVARRRLGVSGIPVFDSGRSAIDAIARLNRPIRSGAQAAEKPVHLPTLPAQAVVTEAAGAGLLDAAGVPRPAGGLARTPEEAAALARRLEGPVVLKVQSPDLLHKSEHGGVRVGVEPELVAGAFEHVIAAVGSSRPDVVIDGVLVQELAPRGIELLVGVVREQGDYPPVVTVGMGGVNTEIYADVASALAPLDTAGASALLRRLKGYRLLDGYRGADPIDLDAAARAVSAISQLACSLGSRLREVEVNPLIAHPTGVTAADFLLILTAVPAEEADEHAHLTTTTKDR